MTIDGRPLTAKTVSMSTACRHRSVVGDQKEIYVSKNIQPGQHWLIWDGN